MNRGKGYASGFRITQENFCRLWWMQFAAFFFVSGYGLCCLHTYFACPHPSQFRPKQFRACLMYIARSAVNERRRSFSASTKMQLFIGCCLAMLMLRRWCVHADVVRYSRQVLFYFAINRQVVYIVYALLYMLYMQLFCIVRVCFA